MSSAPSETAKAAQHQVRKILFHFVVELRKEAGPYVQAIGTLAAMGRGHVRKLRASLGKGRPSRGPLKALRGYAEQYERDIVGPLEKAARGRRLDERTAKKIVADRCEVLQKLVDDFLRDFPVAPPLPSSRRPVSPTVVRTAVAFDLVGYSKKIRARTATHPAGEHSVEALQDIRLINTTIHYHIDAALQAANVRVSDRTFVTVQGDGGIIEFVEIASAFQFAECLHRVVASFNLDSAKKASGQDGKYRELREYRYRVAASHGWVTVNPDVHLRNKPELWRVGLAYYEAARLLPDAPIDGIRTTDRTYTAFREAAGTEHPSVRGYTGVQSVVVKHDEEFAVRDKTVAIVS